ncbi:hypothetical protein Tco_1025731 [Tanacetum coccineum]
MEATLKDMLSNQFKDVEKYAYHLGQSQNYIENQIVWESRIVEVVRITNEQQHVLDFMEQIIMMRENDKPSSFSKADFRILNKNDIEDMYYICLDKKRVHDFQLGIERYQIKINLTAPTLIFPCIEECEAFSIIDKSTTGFIYLNNKNHNRFMDLEELYGSGRATKVL